MSTPSMKSEARLFFSLLLVFFIGVIGFVVWLLLQFTIGQPNSNHARREAAGEYAQVPVVRNAVGTDFNVSRHFESMNGKFSLTLPGRWIAREATIAGTVELRRVDEAREYPRGRLEIAYAPIVGSLSLGTWKERFLFSRTAQRQQIASISGLSFEMIQTIQSNGEGADLVTDGYFGLFDKTNIAYALFLHYQDEFERNQMNEILATFQASR